MLSCSVESDSVTPWAVACQRSLVHGDSPGQNTGVGCLSLPQGFFPTQGSNPGLPPCRRILYCLSHQGSPRILQWVAYPFSRDLPDPGIKLGSPALQAILYQLSYQEALGYHNFVKTLKSGHLHLPTLFFGFKVVLAILYPLHF